MGPEARIERTICDEAKADGWVVRKLRFLDANGAPDRLFGKARRTVVIEFKAPGEEPTRQQLKRHAELRDEFGWEVYWCDDFDEPRRILQLAEM